jgi:hypothetical protein
MKKIIGRSARIAAAVCVAAIVGCSDESTIADRNDDGASTPASGDRRSAPPINIAGEIKTPSIPVGPGISAEGFVGGGIHAPKGKPLGGRVKVYVGVQAGPAR